MILAKYMLIKHHADNKCLAALRETKTTRAIEMVTSMIGYSISLMPKIRLFLNKHENDLYHIVNF